MQLEVEAELEIAHRHHKPQTAYEQRLVDMCALSTVRILRIFRAEDLHTRTRVRHATDQYDAQKAAQLQSLVELLQTDPAQALPQLARLAEGCDYLADAWHDLQRRLTDSPTPELLTTARRLLGLSEESTPRLSSHAQFLADLASITPSSVSSIPSVPSDPFNPQSVPSVLSVPSDPPVDPALLPRLQTFLATQHDLWTERAEARWQHIDGPDRAEAPDRALVDLTPEGDRLHRYLAANQRDRRQAILELQQIQRDRTKNQRDPLARPDSALAPAGPPPPRAVFSPLPPGEGQGEGSSMPPAPPADTPRKNEPKHAQPLTIEEFMARPDLPAAVRDRILAHLNRSTEPTDGPTTPKRE
jgi:hypothetical protein